MVVVLKEDSVKVSVARFQIQALESFEFDRGPFDRRPSGEWNGSA